jgi:deoxyribonuclease V
MERIYGFHIRLPKFTESIFIYDNRKLTMDNAKNELLTCPSSTDEAIAIQKKWQKIYATEINKKANISIKEVNLVAGVDISYSTKDPSYGVCCAVLWNLKSKSVVETLFLEGSIGFPYVPGLLAFREGPMIHQTIEKLSKKPDLVMFDGYGYCHPKRFGEAIHIGYAMDIPSIGIAKSPFVGNFNEDKLKAIKNQKERKGFKVEIKENNEVLGYITYLSNLSKPVYVSYGYRTDLNTALNIALHCTMNQKQPEALFLADQVSRQELKKKGK